MTTLRKTLILSMMAAGVPSAADLQAGKAVYDRACKSCHGANGVANPAIAKSLKVEMHDLGSKEVQALSDDEIKAIITDGKGKMRPVKTVSGSDVDNVVAYIRTFKK
jgi:mono/diheme cytochrome c family protein